MRVATTYGIEQDGAMLEQAEELGKKCFITKYEALSGRLYLYTPQKQARITELQDLSQCWQDEAPEGYQWVDAFQPELLETIIADLA